MSKELLKSDERQKLLEARLKSLGISANKLLRGEQLDFKHKEFVSTGQTEIDLALGDLPGIAFGSLVEFIGESASGKTYLALKCAAEAQKLGKRVAFFNVENSFYEPRAQALGVQTRNSDLFELYENIGAGETWGELAKALVQSKEYGLIVIDSVTAMIPQADYEKSLDQEAKIGAHARMTGRLSQKLTELCADSGTIVILINQFRYGAGAMPGTLVKKSTGGESLGFYCNTRLVFSKINGAAGIVYNSEKEVVGGRSKVFGLKNRFGAPHFTIDFPIFFSIVESDPVIEFLMRAKAKQFELIKEARKVYKYVTEDGEVIESKSTFEFINLLKGTPSPSKRSKNDDSKTAFEFICRKIKFSPVMVQKLNEKLETSVEDISESFEMITPLAEMSPDEIKEIIG
jgi:protein RecA